VRKFAVLGAGGFIGYRLTEYLLLNEVAVPRPIVRSFRSMARVSKFDLDMRIANALDVRGLADALEGCEAAFHCVVGNRNTILGSIEATYAACRQAGVKRLIYLSSAVVHGHNPCPGTDEDSPLLKVQPFDYNVSKVLAEEKLRSMMRDATVECVILRPCIVFGPRSTFWSAQLASDILAGKAYLVDGGLGICNTIFVDNLVDVMVLCAKHPAAPGNTFIVKDAERVTWRQLYTALAAAVGVDPSGIQSVSSAADDGPPVLPASESVYYAARTIWKSRVFRAAKELVRSPSTVSLAIKLRSWLKSPETRAVARRPPAQSMVLDPEIVSLQLCQYELPTRRLANVLNYQPRVSFDVASLRTAEWLRFAFGSAE
jgi:nucleoside-diphosphate-sugar epimerase